MTFYSVSNPFMQVLNLQGTGLNDGDVYFGVAGQDPITHPVSVYWDLAGTQLAPQPIDTSGGYLYRSGTPAAVYINDTYSIKILDKNGALIYYQANVNDPVFEFIDSLASPTGATKIGYTPRGWNAPSTVKTVLDNTVIAQLVDGLTTDQTSAIDNAVAALGSNGGYIEIPAGTFLVNATIAQSNIVLRGQGGRGEFNQACLNPHSLSSPTLTFGNDTTVSRYCGIENLHVSGAKVGTGGTGPSLIADQAPAALMFKGGIVNFTSNDCVLYNGVKTLNMTPATSTSQPISVININGGAIRNDVTDSATARAIYGIRKGIDLAYLTAIQFWGVHVSGPTLGYAAEIDGTASGWTFSINGCYFDVEPGAGILLKGGAGIVSWNSQLDPGALGAVVIEADQAPTDISRLVAGSLLMQLQKIKFNDASTLTVPANMSFFTDTAHLFRPQMGPNGYIFSPLHPLDETYAAQYNFNGTNVNWQGGFAHLFDSFLRATHYEVGGNQVVGARQPTIAHATDAASAITQLNLAIDALRTHGLIA